MNTFCFQVLILFLNFYPKLYLFVIFFILFENNLIYLEFIIFLELRNNSRDNNKKYYFPNFKQ